MEARKLAIPLLAFAGGVPFSGGCRAKTLMRGADDGGRSHWFTAQPVLLGPNGHRRAANGTHRRKPARAAHRRSPAKKSSPA